MKPQILQINPLLASCSDALAEAYDVHRYWEAEDKDALLARIAPDVSAIATGAGCSGAIMEALPKLKLISSFGVGYDAVDVATARRLDIRVTNTPDVLSDAVAEFTLGLMLALCRRIPETDAYVRAGSWEAEGNWRLTGELTGARLGIVGLGRIGKEIAARAAAFKMRIAYHGRREQAYQPYEYFANLVEMARAVDWLVLIAPGGAATRHLVNREVLEALGPDGGFVNVGRGTSVDEAALVDCLSTGKLGGAALDVFEDEPRVPEALFGLDNVILSPHQASATHKTRFAMGQLVVDNIHAHFAGEPLISPVA